jgi:hypothetical protein
MQLSYWVRAYDRVDNYNHGKSNLFTLDINPPTIPQLTFPNNNQHLNANDLYIDWNHSSDNNTSQDDMLYEYRLYSKNPNIYPSAGYFSVIYSGTTRHPSTGFASGTGEYEYWYTVQAIDQAGNESGFAPYRRIVVDNTAPVVILETPTDDFITTKTSFVQTWSTTDPNIDYFEYRSCSNNPTVDGFCDEIYSTTTSNTSRTVNNHDITFWWQVRGVDKAGNVGDWAEARKAMMDNTAPESYFTTNQENTSHNSGIPIQSFWIYRLMDKLLYTNQFH